MTGIILAAHGTLAKAALETVELLSGEKERVVCISFQPGDSLDLLIARFQEAIGRLGSGEGLLIVTDIKGGSPCNVATLMQKTGENIRTLYGLNVGMLLQAFESRDDGAALEELARAAEQSGKVSVGLVELKQGGNGNG